MLTWVIVKTRIDSSLNLYEHCVACDDENNCPVGSALRGQPCGAAYHAYPAFDLRCTPLRGVKTPRKAVYSYILFTLWGDSCAFCGDAPKRLKFIVTGHAVLV